MASGQAGAAARIQRGSSQAAKPATGEPRLPTCPFDVGDTVDRGGIGAAVPPRGEGVAGFLDGPSESYEIQIETSLDGVVTITPGEETCRLPE
jgi:hypothetical protein